MQLNDFLEKFLPEYEQKLNAWQKSYGFRPVTISQQKHEFSEMNIPEALSNFADRICERQRENCKDAATIINVDYGIGCYDEIDENSIINAEQPKIKVI